MGGENPGQAFGAVSRKSEVAVSDLRRKLAAWQRVEDIAGLLRADPTGESLMEDILRRDEVDPAPTAREADGTALALVLERLAGVQAVLERIGGRAGAGDDVVPSLVNGVRDDVMRGLAGIKAEVGELARSVGRQRDRGATDAVPRAGESVQGTLAGLEVTGGQATLPLARPVRETVPPVAPPAGEPPSRDGQRRTGPVPGAPVPRASGDRDAVPVEADAPGSPQIRVQASLGRQVYDELHQFALIMRVPFTYAAFIEHIEDKGVAATVRDELGIEGHDLDEEGEKFRHYMNNTLNRYAIRFSPTPGSRCGMKPTTLYWPGNRFLPNGVVPPAHAYLPRTLKNAISVVERYNNTGPRQPVSAYHAKGAEPDEAPVPGGDETLEAA